MTSSLANEYFEAEARPANVLYDFASNGSTSVEFGLELDLDAGHTVADDGEKKSDDNANNMNSACRVFIIPDLLSDQECDDLIEDGENAGIGDPHPSAGTFRTAKRTNNYHSTNLSNLVHQRIQTKLTEKLAHANDGMGSYHGIHNNWRIVRYDPGDKFPAHQDQMDSIQVKNEETGMKELFVSSHTLIVNLSQPRLLGGNLRFYPNCKVRPTGEKPQCYNYSVDVRVPRGWAVAFRQKGLIHAGQPVSTESPVPKYVAQAGILRRMEPGMHIQPSVFRNGPGLNALLGTA